MFVPNSNWHEIALFLLGLRINCKVSGDSMRPILYDGDEVLAKKIHGKTPLCEGDMVVLKHPKKNLKLIKQIHSVDSSGVFVTGTCENSLDSRTFGVVSRSCIIGLVTSKF